MVVILGSFSMLDHPMLTHNHVLNEFERTMKGDNSFNPISIPLQSVATTKKLFSDTSVFCSLCDAVYDGCCRVTS